QQGSANPATLNAIVNAMPVATALTLVRALLPVLEQAAAKQLVNVLEHGPEGADDDVECEPAPSTAAGFRDLSGPLPEDEHVGASDGSRCPQLDPLASPGSEIPTVPTVERRETEKGRDRMSRSGAEGERAQGMDDRSGSTGNPAPAGSRRPEVERRPL